MFDTNDTHELQIDLFYEPVHRLSKPKREHLERIVKARNAIASSAIHPNISDVAKHLQCSRYKASQVLRSLERDGVINRAGLGWVLAGGDLVCSSDIEKALGIQKHIVRAMTTRGYLASPSRGRYVMPEDIQKTYQDYLTGCYENNVQGIMAAAEVRKKVVVDTHHRCGECNLLKEIETGYYWRKRSLDRCPILARCKECEKKRVVRQRNEKGFEKEFQARYGFSSIVVMRWANDHGYGWKVNVFTIEGYRLYRARRKLVNCLRRIRDKLSIKQSTVVDQDKIWEYYNSFGRLTEFQAWKHWKSIAPIEWFRERGMMPPTASFPTKAEWFKYKYREFEQFRDAQKMKQSLKRKLRGKVFKMVEAAIYNSTESNSFSTATEKVLGYSSKEFHEHMKSLYTEDMTVDKRCDVHIDHIIPVSLFVKSGAFEGSAEEVLKQVRLCWSLPNLRPMRASDNIRKGAKIVREAMSEELISLVESNNSYIYQRLSGS